MSSTATIGQRVRYARNLRGMTQRQLAQACRSSKYTISCVENDNRNLQAFLFMEIGRVLSVSLDWLAFGKSEAA